MSRRLGDFITFATKKREEKVMISIPNTLLMSRCYLQFMFLLSLRLHVALFIKYANMNTSRTWVECIGFFIFQNFVFWRKGSAIWDFFSSKICVSWRMILCFKFLNSNMGIYLLSWRNLFIFFGWRVRFFQSPLSTNTFIANNVIF